MEILCVLPSIPLPTNTGGTQRTLYLLRALDEAFQVTTLALDRGGDADSLRRMLHGPVITVARPSDRVRDLVGNLKWGVRGLPMGYEPYASPQMRAALDALLQQRRFDVVHFDHLHTAQLIPVVRRRLPDCRIVIDEHNVEAQVFERVAKLSHGSVRAMLKEQARRVAALESKLVAEADAVLACSSRDGGLLRWNGARFVRVTPNGVDLQELQVPPAAQRKNVVFVGSMDWWPNSDAALRLVKEIWPLAAPQLDDSRLTIVGRNPPEAVRELADERVVVTGTVESVKPHLASAWATAIPLRAGSGTRLKILEAAAARVPVVATRLAAEGLPLVDGEHLLFAESPQEFAQALVRLKREPDLAARLANAAQHVVQEFDWRQVGASLANFYQGWVGRPQRDSCPPAGHAYVEPAAVRWAGSDGQGGDVLG